jgi:transcriptional regulator with XRE-family HTH domain
LKPAELLAIRRALGLSQVELARKLEISARAVSRYETGARRITKVLELAVRYLHSKHR